MSDILCIYYSRTGNTRRAVKAIAADLGAEIVAIDDGADRNGWRGTARSAAAGGAICAAAWTLCVPPPAR